ncbi:MAG: protein-methionine-sulfoxide reductase catalytic subunit MsrP [Anaerolineae bacterium]|nr:protein-methionine-sulfoxide reductase catalytic subunit MsrP [Anaerolineae bacterium]
MKRNSYKSVPIQSSEITPENIYMNRRLFMKAAGTAGLSTLLAACGVQPSDTSETPSVTEIPATGLEAGAATDELGDPLTSYKDVTNYNNFYEFTTSKTDVASLSKDFVSSPWTIEIGGLVNNPKTYGVDDLLTRFTQEERIYRLRCVEAWSMVIPWTGFELAALLDEVEPLASAKYVAFTSLLDPDQMPGQNSAFYPWPYTEGLRLDEAYHDLTILATGLYGKPMPAPNGAPIRLVVPWKYGFKSIKSIVKIGLTDTQPATLWNTISPREYGFYSNVNPEVNHPRWSQATERRIGETGRRETLMFNGYTEEVADLYAGMSLTSNY